MKPIWLGILSAALVLTGGWLVVLGMGKAVTLVVDGQQRYLVTSAFTVGGLLKAENISVGEQDFLQPEADQWIKNSSVILLERGSQIHIQTDDSSNFLLSTERFPANLLSLAGVRLYPGDRLLADGQPALPDQKLASRLTHSIQVLRAVPLYLVDLGSQARTIYSAAATLGQALWEAGITLYNSDRISPGLETPLSSSLQATLTRSREVVIQTKSGQVKTRLAAASVGEALNAAGLAPQGLDYSQPPLESPLPVDGQIRLVRVEESVQLEQKLLPFETLYQP
ncbi:MAG: ubiquitin-like domain-containing protein, partial [Anaerolineales bacterium]|nr:ubiquitin-like domain-containing protein [Anaerolineales bacterium]